MKEVKKVVLIGASGFVGSALLNETLNRGFEVTAVVRHPEKIKIENESLKVTKADVSSLEEVYEVCKGADAVISAFNPGWNNPDIYDETIKVYLTIIDGVKKAGVNRFLMVGGAGSLFIAPGLRLMDSGEVPENLLPGVKALGEFYLKFLTKEKEVDWVFFSPAADMRPGVRTGRYRLGKDDMIVDIVGNSHISVEDYAAAMIDELEHPQRRACLHAARGPDRPRDHSRAVSAREQAAVGARLRVRRRRESEHDAARARRARASGADPDAAHGRPHRDGGSGAHRPGKAAAGAGRHRRILAGAGAARL